MMKKRFGISVLILLILSLTVYAATRPTQGGSNNNWGTELNTWLDVAHTSDGEVKAGYITSGMILDATVATADLANFSITNVKIGLSAVNGSQINTNSALNVSNLILTGANNTGALTTAVANVTGIFFNKTQINLPAINADSCAIVPINMTGIPAGVSCLAVGYSDSLATSSINVYGLNSTVNNCRLSVCNLVNGSVDLPLLAYGAFGIATGLDGTVPGPAS